MTEAAACNSTTLSTADTVAILKNLLIIDVVSECVHKDDAAYAELLFHATQTIRGLLTLSEPVEPQFIQSNV